MRLTQWTGLVLSCLVLTACGGGGGGDAGSDSGNSATPPKPTPTPVPPTYSVGGTVNGLTGGELVLTLNGTQPLVVRADGAFVFPQGLSNGSSFTIGIQAQPTLPSQTCVLASDFAQGQVNGTDMRRATVQCSVNRFGIGGQVVGLKGQGLTLQLNGGTALPMASEGTFRFPDALPSGTGYQVVVASQPQSPSQTCSIGGGAAAGTVVNQDVSDLVVQCSTNRYAVTARVEGLTGSGLVLRNNGADDLAVTANGPVTFPALVSSDAGYAVTVQRQPTAPTQTCSVVNGAGTSGLTSATVDTVRVVCATRSFSVSGQVTGLVGTGLVLRNNGGDDAVPDSTGRFKFATPVASGSRYLVSVRSQPTQPSQTCTVNAGTEAGPITDSDVANVSVSCATNAYKVGGQMRGLWSPFVTLQLNGAEDLEVRADGRFEFTRALASGSAYRISVKAQPRRPLMQCDVTAESGTLTNADVYTPEVRCTPVAARLAYLLDSYGSYGGGLRLYDIDAGTGAMTAATGDGAYGSGSSSSTLVGPSFSADGRLAAISGVVRGWPYPGSVDVMRLDPQTGRIRRLATKASSIGGPTSAILHPSGQFVYTPTITGTITVYKVDESAETLTQTSVAQSMIGEGNGGFVDAAGRFLYVYSDYGRISVLSINPTDGSLTPVQDLHPTENPASIRVKMHPSGRFIYVMAGGGPGRAFYSGSIITLAVDPVSGKLLRVGETSDMGRNTQDFDIHPSGQFLYINSAGHYDLGSFSPMVYGSVTAMAINPITGLPSRLQADVTNNFPVGYCVSVEPTGRYLYADASSEDTSTRVTRMFRIDPASGQLSLERTLPVGTACMRFREAG